MNSNLRCYLIPVGHQRNRFIAPELPRKAKREFPYWEKRPLPARKRTPKYCLQKSSGLAYVKIDGRRHYLGKHDSEDSKARYQELINQWQTRLDPETPVDLTIGERSIWIPGSQVSRTSTRECSKALPRPRALWTNSKKPRYKGKFSCETPRWGRSQLRKSDQNPSIVLT